MAWDSRVSRIGEGEGRLDLQAVMCYRWGMVRNLTIILLTVAVMLEAPLAAVSVGCCRPAQSHQPVALSDGCCAAISCCLIANQSTTPPVGPGAIAHEFGGVPAPASFVRLIDFSSHQSPPRLAHPPQIAHSPPPLAVTGVCLI